MAKKKLFKNKNLKKIKRTLIYWVILFFIRLLRSLNRKSSINLMRGIGRIAFVLARNERKKSLRHLTWAYGTEKTPTEIKDLARQVFQTISTCVADAIRLPNLVEQGLDTIVTSEGLDNLTHAMARGKGVILQTGHFGNWELLGTWLVQKQIPMKVIAKKAYDPRLDKLIVDYRNQAGYAVTSRGNAMKILVDGLNSGFAFGLLFDIDTKVKGSFVNFFGKPAHTATAPAMLALQLDCPLVPVFIRLRKDFTYHVTIQKPLQLSATGDVGKDTLINTQKCSDVYEYWIRKHPEQWIWMHERWKKKPTDPPRPTNKN